MTEVGALEWMHIAKSKLLVVEGQTELVQRTSQKKFDRASKDFLLWFVVLWPWKSIRANNGPYTIAISALTEKNARCKILSKRYIERQKKRKPDEWLILRSLVRFGEVVETPRFYPHQITRSGCQVKDHYFLQYQCKPSKSPRGRCAAYSNC